MTYSYKTVHSLLSVIFVFFSLQGVSQTTNTSPLPAGQTIIGNHLHVGDGNEVWTDAISLYFNYKGAAATTYFWNLGGGSGKPIMTLLNNGNVGINKLDPSDKLDVVGSALIGENQVNSNTTKLFLRNASGKTWAISSGANMISENIFSIYNWTDNSATPFFQINSTGNVSITNTSASTNSTSGALVVNGDIGTGGRIFSQLGTGSIFSTKYYTGNYGTVLYMTNDVGQTQKAIRMKTAYSGIGTSGNANFSIDRSINAQAYNADPSTLSYTESLVIDGNNGNVGIGTTTPNAKLDIQGKIHAGGDIYGYTILTFQDDSRFNVTSATIPNLTCSPFSMPQYGIAAPNTGGSADLWIAGCNAIRMFTAGNPTPGVNILSSGNVGIGTTNPAYKLDVLGTIRAKEVLVNLDGGADFVFEKDYKLPTIEHVATYVQENKHLPDIPSANEMTKNGVSMGDLQVKLLQKVEELTLYVIGQQKQINQLKRELKK